MALLTIKLSSGTKTIEPKTTAPSAPYLAQKTSDGTLYYPLETYTSGEGLLIKGNGITYKVQEITVPNADDPYVQVSNILDFISGYTTGQVCFQGNRNGKFYVKAGSFTSGVNPDLPSNGVLIYDGVADAGAIIDNYVCAAHVANIINFILFNTLGSGYGSSVELYLDTPWYEGDYSAYTEKNEQTISKGLSMAFGSADQYRCTGRGYTGYYGSVYIIYSNSGEAIWW